MPYHPRAGRNRKRGRWSERSARIRSLPGDDKNAVCCQPFAASCKCAIFRLSAWFVVVQRLLTCSTYRLRTLCQRTTASEQHNAHACTHVQQQAKIVINFQKTIQCMHAGKEKKKGIPARTRTLATVNVAYIQQAYLISARAVHLDG